MPFASSPLAAERKKKTAEERKAKAAQAKVQQARVKALTKALTPFAGTDFWVGSSTPEKKLRNVRTRSEIPEDEAIVAVLDCTVLGSAKDHWAFTDNALYYHVYGQRETIAYDQLKSLSYVPEKGSVLIGPKLSMPLGATSLNSEKVVEVLESIKQQL